MIDKGIRRLAQVVIADAAKRAKKDAKDLFWLIDPRNELWLDAAGIHPDHARRLVARILLTEKG